MAGELVRPPVMICSTEGKKEAVRISTRLNWVDYWTISKSRHTKHYLPCNSHMLILITDQQKKYQASISVH